MLLGLFSLYFISATLYIRWCILILP